MWCTKPHRFSVYLHLSDQPKLVSTCLTLHIQGRHRWFAMRAEVSCTPGLSPQAPLSWCPALDVYVCSCLQVESNQPQQLVLCWSFRGSKEDASMYLWSGKNKGQNSHSNVHPSLRLLIFSIVSVPRMLHLKPTLWNSVSTFLQVCLWEVIY